MTKESAAWFVDGAYLFKVWQKLGRADKLDYLKLRNYLESTFQVSIDDAYYFNADPDPPTSKMNAFHASLSYPPPGGPGLRVKLYWLHERLLNWPEAWGGGPIVHPTTKQQYKLVQQKGVDVGLAFHLIRSYGHRKWRKLFFAAGDGDFHEAIQHLVEHEDVDVHLIGAVGSISTELMPYGRVMVELDKMADKIARP